MRYALLVFAMIAFCLGNAGVGQAAGSAQPTIVVTPLPPPTAAAAATTSPADQWANSGQRQFGPNYQIYVPMEFKSDNPGVMRSFDPAGLPQNGNQQTAAGEACTTDADCQAPMGCFNRADSGQIPVKLCALPAGR